MSDTSKTLRFVLAAIVLVALVCPIGCASDGARTSGKPAGYDDAMKAARLNAKTVRGKRYEKSIQNQFGVELRDVAQSCFFKKPEGRGVKLLYRFDAKGEPIESMIYPASQFADCFSEGIRHIEFPPPPEPDYWFVLHVPGISSVGSRQ